MLPWLLLSSALAVEPHSSFHQLISANGVGVAVFNGAASGGVMLDHYSDHLYKVPSPGAEETRDLLYDAYFGLASDAGGGWATSSASYGYDGQSGVLRAERSAGGLSATEYAFAPMGWAAPALVHVLHIRNEGSATATGVRAWALQNFHLGADGDGDGLANEDEGIWVEEGLLLEQGVSTGLGFLVRPLSPADRWSCDRAWSTVNEGRDLDSRCGSSADPWVNNDQVGALQWDLGDLGPGEERWVGAVWAFSSGGDPRAPLADLEAWLAGRGAEELVVAERTWWADWLAAGTPPAGLREEDRPLYEQSLVFLKSAQVREEGAPHGQIPASFPVAAPVGDFQHTWNITWVRDGVYSIRALIAAGYLEEAEAGLAFFLQEGRTGYYSDYVEGLDYRLSVCRVYGDGTEWSDEDADGPNIEYDGFGLFLQAVAELVRARGDTAFVEAHEEAIVQGIGDVLVELVEEDGSAEGLVAADSSIWERHWNGKQKHFTYTSIHAAPGLSRFAEVLELMGDADRAVRYREVGSTIAAAAQEKLVDGDGVIAGSLEELQSGTGYLDLAAIEGTLNLVWLPDSPEALASLDRWGSELAVASGQGYRRNDDGDLYDEHEWLMIDLRMALALRRACREEEGEALLAWVREQAELNHLTIPELLDPEDGDYAGPAPMLGFGAGAWVLTMHGWDTMPCTEDPGDEGGEEGGEEDSAAPADSGGEAGGDGATGSGGAEGLGGDGAGADRGEAMPAKAGCSCQSAGAPGAWFGLGLVGLLCRRRRA